MFQCGRYGMLWKCERRTEDVVGGLSGGSNWVRLCGCVSKEWRCEMEVRRIMLNWGLWFLVDVCAMDWC